ncbi:MAG: HAD family phosphatase [Thermoanaerobaculia bacterium]|nr:HAD family phosphatase [Thermoanaerobaculia bacterium]
MLRAILFDFNGILVDDEPIHLELFQQVLDEEGIALSREDYWKHYLGFDDAECFRAVFRSAGRELEAAHSMRLIARKASYYRERMRRSGYPFFPGGVELVLQASEAGLTLGVVSGALREEIEGALQQAKIRTRFKLIVGAEDVSASKPDPEGYRVGLQQLNSQPPLPDRLFHPHEVLAIEDSPAGLQAARGVGLCTLGVAQTYGREELGLADVAVEKLAGLQLGELLERLDLAE